MQKNEAFAIHWLNSILTFNHGCEKHEGMVFKDLIFEIF